MSRAGVVYNLATAEIEGIIQVSQDSDLFLNYDLATQGLIEVPMGHAIFTEQLKWRVSGGALIENTVVTISVDKTTFAADGIEEVLVTLTGQTGGLFLDMGGGLISPPILMVDPTLIITSDVPRTFTLQIIDPTKSQWAEPVTVEAI